MSAHAVSAAPLLTVDQVAGRYQLAPKTVRAYARAGRVVGAVKVGAQWRFDATVLAILPAAPAGPPVALVHPAAPTSTRRARPGSGREALQAALAQPIKAAPSRGAVR